MAHDDTYSWLDETKAKTWLKLETDDADRDAVLDLCRRAVAKWVEDQRRDLLDDDGAFQETPSIVVGALLALGRLWDLYDKGVSFQELGAAKLLDQDGGVRQYIGRNPRPVLG